MATKNKTDKEKAIKKTQEVERDFQKVANPQDIEAMQKSQVPAAVVDKRKLDLVEAEIERGYREVDIKRRNGESFKARIYFTTVGDDEEVSMAYSRVFNELLKHDDMFVEEQLLNIYKERGVWTEEHEDKVKKLEEDIKEVKEEITDLANKKKMTQTVKQKITKAYARQADIMQELTDLKEKKQTLVSSSVESRAMDIALRVKLCCTIRDENGEKIWEDVIALGEETDKALVISVMNKALFFWGGLPDDFLGE